MWNVLNLSMSQIWKTVYKYCGLKCFCLLCTTLSSHTDTALVSMSTLKACGLFSTAYEPQLQHFFLSFFFFCLFGETMFICNRRNPFRDVRTWGHLQNVAPRVALRLVSHMPFLTSSFHCSRGRGENSTKNNDPEMNKLDFLTCGFLNHENIFTKKG